MLITDFFCITYRFYLPISRPGRGFENEVLTLTEPTVPPLL